MSRIRATTNEVLTIAVVGAFLTLLAVAPGEARNRPTVDPGGIWTCMEQGNSHGGESALWTCCYDDGCFICDAKMDNCVWDPKYGPLWWDAGQYLVVKPPLDAGPGPAPPPFGPEGNLGFPPVRAPN